MPSERAEFRPIEAAAPARRALPYAALGVVAIVLVAAGPWAATALARRSGAALFRS